MIKYLVMDVDGTLTDGKIYMGDGGEIMKAFNIKDGYGVGYIAVPAGITPVIITARESKILLNRCKEMKVTEVYQGVLNKLDKLKEITNSLNDETNLSSVAYIGDDVIDLQCMLPVKKAGGLVGCPKDAAREVIEAANFVSEHNGGDGAVRDFIEWIVNKNNDGIGVR